MIITFKRSFTLTKDDVILGIKGRISTFLMVLFINSLYIIYYYIRDGFISSLEYVGLPVMLVVSVWAGKQYDKAKFFSEKDILTGLYNRRFVKSFFPKIKKLSDRNRKKIAVILIDVNDFKVINDCVGHKAGDELLKALSRKLEESVRDKDIVARWGGDEFLVISRDIRKREDVERLVDRIHQNVKRITNTYVETSVSIGSASYPSDGQTLEQLLSIADKHMYHMKSQKKPNRDMLAHPQRLNG